MNGLVKDGKYIGPLEVGGSLNLRGCTGLTELPKGLEVNGSLYLEGCTGLARLFPGVESGWIYLQIT